FTPDGGGAQGDERGGQPTTEVGLDAARRPLGNDLATPQEPTSNERERQHHEKEGAARPERPAVHEDASDHDRQGQRERDPAQAGREGQNGRGDDDTPRARVVLPETAFDGAGASAPSHPPGSGRNARA